MAEEDQQDEAQKEDVNADGDEGNAEGQDGESEGEGEDEGKGGKKKILLIVGLVLILAVGGGAGAYFLGYLDGLLGLKGDAPMHCVVDTHGEETCEPVHCEVDDHGEEHCDPAMRCEIDDHGDEICEEVVAEEDHSGDDHGSDDGHGDGHGGGGGKFVEVPTMLVNLNTDDGTPRFLRLSVQIELKSAGDYAAVEAALPRVVDQFQTYLRELRVKDLRGSAGIYRLQMELLWRVNKAAAPVKIKDVLFQEILIQ